MTWETDTAHPFPGDLKQGVTSVVTAATWQFGRNGNTPWQVPIIRAPRTGLLPPTVPMAVCGLTWRGSGLESPLSPQGCSLYTLGSPFVSLRLRDKKSHAYPNWGSALSPPRLPRLPREWELGQLNHGSWLPTMHPCYSLPCPVDVGHWLWPMGWPRPLQACLQDWAWTLDLLSLTKDRLPLKSFCLFNLEPKWIQKAWDRAWILQVEGREGPARLVVWRSRTSPDEPSLDGQTRAFFWSLRFLWVFLMQQ